MLMLFFIFRGNYSEFMNTMTERHKSQQREYEAQVEHRKHVQAFIDKFRFNAKRASLVQSRIKQLEKLPELVPIDKDTEVTLKFPDVEKLSGPIFTMSEVAFAYPDRETVFSNVDLMATMESRICIVGENGAGKTTLLKLVMDMLTPTQGQRTCHRNLKFGYFSQHHVDQLEMEVSIWKTIKL
jgi:ATP-binding cassette subfamily F protein 3